MKIATNLLNFGVRTGRITTDEDSSIIKNLQERVRFGHFIQKSSDPIHLKKIFIKDLKELKK